MEKRKKTSEEQAKRRNVGSNSIRVHDARMRGRKPAYRDPVHMEPTPTSKKRNLGFVFFGIAACGAWPCILMYVVTSEPIFMALVCICIAAMVLALMFEQGEYYE